MKNIYILLISVLFYGCGDSDEKSSIPTDLVTGIKATDIGNAGNASDISLLFSVSDITQTTEFRVVVLKEAEVAQLDAASAASLSPDNYFSIESKLKKNEFKLEQSMKDFSGNPIVNDVPYIIKIVMVNNSDMAVADLSSSFLLQDVSILQGKYIGQWDDNINTNLGISADLTFVNGILSGPFYATPSFSSCCGGEDDGSLTIKIEENTITSFFYDQVLITFMNGCNGQYTGTGRVRNTTELVIDFEGNDCEGSHTGGKITMKKI